MVDAFGGQDTGATFYICNRINRANRTDRTNPMTDIFIAYSHEDIHFKNVLKKFLQPLLREGRVSVWDDYDIEAGKDWDAAIKERLYGAGIVLLLVSADSLASEYFYGKEVQVSLERHERNEAIVVPVVLRHCDWKNTPLKNLEALPDKGRPVVEWPSADQAWQNVVDRLREVVAGIESRRARESAAAEQYRRFTAAVTAAENLANNQNWQEARTAYINALALHQPGYVPDRAGIEYRRAECDQNLRAEAERQAEQARADEAERKRRAVEQRRQQAAPPSAADLQALEKQAARRLIFGALGVLALALILWLALGDRSGADPEPARTDDSALVQLEVAAYNKALEAGTIPALQGYLNRYPAGSKATAARQKLKELEKAFADAKQSAAANETAEEWADALRDYRAAQRLNPEDVEVQRKVRELGKK